MKRVGRLLGVVLLVAGLIRLTAVLWSHSGTFVAETWRNELEKTPDDRVDAIFARIATLGNEAVPVLADALGSGREAVAQAARQTLWAEIEAWEASPGHDLGAKYNRLAAALAERMGQYGPGAKQDAAHVVNHLLSRPLPDAAGRKILLAACTEVLRGQDGGNAAALLDAKKAGSSPSALPVATASAPGREGSAPAADQGSASLASPARAGGPPREAAPAAKATEPTSRTAQAKGGGRPGEPRLLEEASPDAGADPARRPSRLSSRPDKPSRATDGPHPPTSNEPRRLDPVQRLAYEETDASVSHGADGPRIGGDVRAVARRLRGDDPARAEEARKELRRRGFTEQELELASQLTDPNPAVRRKLARVLLSTPGVDAGPWLLELCGDEDADVRLEAITLLATTGDPALIEPLRRRAQLDADERIQRLAERLGRPARSRETKK